MYQMNACGNSGTIAVTEIDKAMTSKTITFAICESALGQVLVARSSVGVCAILIGSDAEDLKRDLGARFPESRLISNESQLDDDLSKVVQFVAAPGVGLDLALDMRGTPFQRRVWNALRTIPVGTTVTYTELARRIGEPNSVRAVAGACASNAIALAVPCHRVIRSNGALSGYRWGVARKRMLLDKEAAA
jgi:O-6-methylguanine DNA methyltransferase